MKTIVAIITWALALVTVLIGLALFGACEPLPEPDAPPAEPEPEPCEGSCVINNIWCDCDGVLNPLEECSVGCFYDVTSWTCMCDLVEADPSNCAVPQPCVWEVPDEQCACGGFPAYPAPEAWCEALLG
jgi:hypothetical protein